MTVTPDASTQSEAPPTRTIPLSVPHLGGREEEYVRQCIETNWVSSAGPFVEEFEKLVAARAGARYGVATVNGTAALHISLLLAGVSPGDMVIVSALTFVAPVNAIRYCGAIPVFMDAEPVYWQMDMNKLEQFLRRECEKDRHGTLHRDSGRRVRAILPVHILGHPVDADPMLELAREFSLKIVEDATESLGASYRGRPVGHLGEIACFSFNGNKVITTGGGGMIVTDDAELARRARYLTTQAKDDAVEFVHGEIGYNYRLTNIQAALGVAQMEQLDHFLDRKRQIAAGYLQAFASLPGVSLYQAAPWAWCTCWLNGVRFDAKVCGFNRRQVMPDFARQGIEVRPLWHPIPTLQPYQGFPAYQVEVVHALYESVLTLPSSVGLGETEQQFVCDVIRKRVAG